MKYSFLRPEKQGVLLFDCLNIVSSDSVRNSGTSWMFLIRFLYAENNIKLSTFSFNIHETNIRVFLAMKRNSLS